MPIFARICNTLPAGLALLAVGCATPLPPGSDAGGRTRAFGPFYEDTRHPDGSGILAVRPFYSRTLSTREPHREIEWLWPLASQRDGPNQRNWRVLVWFGTDYDRDDPLSRARVWLLPFWFHGRNTAGEPYRALFPLGGRIDPFMGMDRFSFVLFPCYMRHQVNDIETVGILWPFFTRTFSRERDIEGLRIFPFYGYMHRGGDWTRRFVLWPVWNELRFDESGPDTGRAWMLIPLAGRIDTRQQEGWYLLPPFVSDIRRRNEGYRRRHFPWPFVQIQDGAVRRRIYWPLWGTRQSETRRSNFMFWPLWLTAVVDDGHQRTERHRLIPVWDDSRTFQIEDGVELSRYLQLWPLMTLRRQGDRTLFRTLDLWPSMNASADRNWAPYWTLYQRREADGNVAVDALWGLWRTRRTAEGGRAGRLWPLYSWRRGAGERGWRLLGGLAGVRRDDTGADLQLAYFLNVPLTDAPAPSP